MKPVKFVVLAAAIIASCGVFLDWIQVSADAPKMIRESMPASGMENGGAVFLFFLGMPLLAAGIGAAKRFGRGLGFLSLVGAGLATLFSLFKWADIEGAADELAKLGGAGTVGVAPGFWLVFFGTFVAMAASFVALIKPEPKPQPAAFAGPQGYPQQPGHAPYPPMSR